MWASRHLHEVMPIALLAILVDRLFHCPVLVLKPAVDQRNPWASLFFRKEFEIREEQDQT
jgi:hypothetical protein